MFLTWALPVGYTGPAITGYAIYQGTQAGGETFLTNLGNVTAYNDTGLSNGQAYYFVIQAVNEIGNGANSSEASATPATVPGVPQAFTATPQDKAAVLAWTAPAGDGGQPVAGYRVYVGTSASDEKMNETVTGLTCTITNLKNGQAYYFSVCAVNVAGAGANATASATPVTVPAAPLSLAATAGNVQVLLGWTVPADDGGLAITGYRVFEGTAPGGETFLATIGNVTSYNASSGLRNGVTYYFTVSAVNVAGAGPTRQKHARRRRARRRTARCRPSRRARATSSIAPSTAPRCSILPLPRPARLHHHDRHRGGTGRVSPKPGAACYLQLATNGTDAAIAFPVTVEVRRSLAGLQAEVIAVRRHRDLGLRYGDGANGTRGVGRDRGRRQRDRHGDAVPLLGACLGGKARNHAIATGQSRRGRLRGARHCRHRIRVRGTGRARQEAEEPPRQEKVMKQRELGHLGARAQESVKIRRSHATCPALPRPLSPGDSEQLMIFARCSPCHHNRTTRGGKSRAN